MSDSETEELILDDRYDEHGRKKKKENTILVGKKDRKLNREKQSDTERE